MTLINSDIFINRDILMDLIQLKTILFFIKIVKTENFAIKNLFSWKISRLRSADFLLIDTGCFKSYKYSSSILGLILKMCMKVLERKLWELKKDDLEFLI